MDVFVGVDCDRWQRLLTRIDRGRRRRALARARGRKVGRKVVGGATTGDCSRSCAWKTAREVTAPEFAHGVHVLGGVERDVDEGRLLTQALRPGQVGRKAKEDRTGARGRCCHAWRRAARLLLSLAGHNDDGDRVRQQGWGLLTSVDEDHLWLGTVTVKWSVLLAAACEVMSLAP